MKGMSLSDMCQNSAASAERQVKEEGMLFLVNRLRKKYMESYVTLQEHLYGATRNNGKTVTVWITDREGGYFIPVDGIHSVRFPDGSRWDAINGYID